MKKVLVIGICIILIFSGCSHEKTIKIGFSAQLTGNEAELGIQERNGVQIAIDEINKLGGINGKELQLIVKDDLGTEEGAKKANEELINDGVVAIIGHATSAQTMFGLEIAEKNKMIMISPTTSTQELSDIDDYFFRVVTSNKSRAEAFSDRIYNLRNIKKLAILYNTDNINYSKTYLDVFEKSYMSSGGKIIKKSSFSSKVENDFKSIIGDMGKLKPDGILIIANDFDTAFIVQTIRLNDINTPIFTSAWAQTETLISHGGKAVEGVEVEIVYPQDKSDSKYVSFKQSFSDRFGKNPSFGASFGYESVYVLKSGLETTNGKKEGLKEALLEIKTYEGLIDEYSFNKYGDVERKFYFSRIENGEFVTIE